jgi:hypothetical protein
MCLPFMGAELICSTMKGEAINMAFDHFIITFKN